MLMHRRNLLTFASAVACLAPALAAAVAKGQGQNASQQADAVKAAPALVLPRLYTRGVDPARYLVSEKYDGVRAYWDGRTLRHRSGRPVAAPAWFIARLPRQSLDGELWLGRGRFEALAGALLKAEPDATVWHELRYMVFELPGTEGPFAARAQAIEQLIDQLGVPQVRAVRHSRVADAVSLQQRLEETVAQGGEGLVLHAEAAPYTTGGTDLVLKLKPEDDAEATVIGQRPGSGKYQGQAGALHVETPEGQRFFLGSGLPDALRRAPPAPGTVVTYRYRGRTSHGVPRFASFVRVHPDL